MGACTDVKMGRKKRKRKELGGPGEEARADRRDGRHRSSDPRAPVRGERERSEVDGWGGSSSQARSNDNEGGERSIKK